MSKFRKNPSRYYVLIGFMIIVCLQGILSVRVSATSTVSYTETPTGYENGSTMTIQMEHSFKVWVTDNNVDVSIWFPRFTDHSHSTMTGVAPLQTVELLSNSSNITPDTYSFDPIDDFNNTYDYFEQNLDIGDELVYNITYEITLRETTWNLEDDEILDYNTTDPFYLDLIRNENNLEVSNPTLISLSDSICSGITSILDKVEAIVDWISANIVYDENAGVSNGAFSTYTSKSGDCSDFSTLFVTLCRIQGIPARKLVGFALFEDGQPVSKPKEGKDLAYSYGSEGGSLPGHAWAEYYVPGYGFVSLDPTWAQSDKEKFVNYMDYIHFTNSVGENYGEGIDPGFPTTPDPITEFALIPLIFSLEPNDVRWETTLDIEVIETDYVGLDIPLHTGTFLIASAGIIALLGIGVSLKIKNKKK